jgi:hypothetical protein
MESKEYPADVSQLVTRNRESDHLKPAAASTVSEGVTALQAHVGTDTSASNASNRDMAKIAALSRIDTIYGMRPKYLRYNLWSNKEEGADRTSTTPFCLVDWTEHAKPLPSVPENEFSNVEAIRTIHNNPDLFKIITPINVD